MMIVVVIGAFNVVDSDSDDKSSQWHALDP